MSGAQIHQLHSSEADREAAWKRFSELAQMLRDHPALYGDRNFMESLWRAETEAKRLFNASLEREAQS